MTKTINWCRNKVELLSQGYSQPDIVCLEGIERAALEQTDPKLTVILPKKTKQNKNRYQ